MPQGTSRDSVLRILHVEDDPVVRDVTRLILARVGHVVDSVADASAAFDALAKNRFDIVIMDCGLQGMDGIEATRHIRANGGEKGRIPVIGLTANDREIEIRVCRDAGMNEVLIKPVSATVLRSAIARHASQAADVSESFAQSGVIADTEPTVDLEQLSQILGENDPSELFDHLQLFLTYFPELMDKIDAAVTGGDCAAIVAPAHTAKGAAATAAARRLRTVLGHLETAARSGIWSEVWLLVPSIRPEFARVEAFIKARGAASA